MHLLVDIGNTETALGLMDPETQELVAHWRLSGGGARTEDEYDHLLFSLLQRIF
jgi:pantothenate kinase type III